MNPYKESEESPPVPRFTYEDIASKLLKDHHFLTALELHTELVESGKELPQLREFFSNPGNFEQHVTRASECGSMGSMHRTPSQATLDSLDTARYSEEGGIDRGGGGGDVAVLEFELRKARETINALRANLTQFADHDSGLDKSMKDKGDRVLKPHEKRALNFLVNEYLLLQDYKLTSITFSDENPDQDFEDWDEVGLNMPRPSGLVSLFCGKSNMAVTCEASTQSDTDMTEIECQTDEENCVSLEGTDWHHEILIQAEEIDLLKQKIISLETDKLNYQKLYDAAILSLNALTTPVAETKPLELKLPDDKLLTVKKIEQAMQSQPLTCTATENHYGSGNSTHSATPEQFEMIENYKCASKKEGSITSSLDPATLNESSVRDSPRRGSVTTLDETLSINDGGEWTRVYEFNSIDANNKEMWIDSALPPTMKASILNWCFETMNVNEPLANDLLSELVNGDKPITLDALLVLVAETLPRIIPHTLVSRRCESVALLACTIHLLANDTSARKAKLLQLLLTLLKKPDAVETRLICEAACLIVKWGGSGEVLSSIAELLASRSSERRILASQICLTIAPYVSVEYCTSLLLSLVMLMCDSSENEVRSLGLKSACLICPIAEHKYGQLENLLFGFLKDPVEKNVKVAVNVLVPVLARTAIVAGKFSSEFCNRILQNLSKSSSEREWKVVQLYLEIMKVLVIAKLCYVVNVQIVRENSLKNCDTENVNYQEISLENAQDNFIDAQCYVTDGNVDVRSLVVAMNCLIRDKPDVRWSEINWFISLIKQILEIATTSKSLNQIPVYSLLITLFGAYVENFGASFTTCVLKPIFLQVINDLEHKMEKLMALNVDSTVLVGIYLVAILSVEDEECGPFMQKWVMYGSIRSLPVRLFAVPLQWVAARRPDALAFYLQQLTELSSSSISSPSGASIRVYIAALVSELLSVTSLAEGCVVALLPAVQALMRDEDSSVREAAITAWGSLTRAAITLQCSQQCWGALEELLDDKSRELSGKETVRAAEALALLILPSVEANDNTAVTLLCSLSSFAPLTTETLAALAPGLQLAAHHCPHPHLAPALRKLEEAVKSPELAQYRPTIEALLVRQAGPAEAAAPKPTNLHAAQEVGRRVSQIFQQKTNMNIPNLFKKKT